MNDNKRVDARHGVICSLPDEPMGYFGWPSVTRTEGGKLVAIASGLRSEHVCPWGKTVLFTSTDDGATWSRPRVLNDTPLDDRDAGIISLGGEKLLATWFSADRRPGFRPDHISQTNLSAFQMALDQVTNEVVKHWSGSWVRTSVDGELWSDYFPAPVNTPHGPIRRASGDLVYFGKSWHMPTDDVHDPAIGKVGAYRSTDDGRTWQLLGTVPTPDDVVDANFHEPHVVELPSGKLIGLIRYEQREGSKAYDGFSMFQSESEDGGRTWSEAHHTGIYGSPPHLIRHSSGALVCVYGYRKPPHGERAMISYDDGRTWDADWVISDAPAKDLGYPCSVEMPDGRILTVYYQYLDGAHRNTSLLYSMWELPD